MAKKTQSKTRRANNEGSIFQRKDGRWAGSATIGYDEDGKVKRKHIYGRTKLEVIDKLNEITNRISSNTFNLIDKIPLKTIMFEWLMVFKKSQVAPRTFEGNIRHFKKYIEPKIGNMLLDEITSLSVQKLLNDMLEQGLSLDYVKKCRFLLRQFFEYAVDNKLISSSPIDKTKVKSADRKIHSDNDNYKALPQNIRDIFIEKLNHHNFLKPLCLTMMFGGLRTGETLSLKWQDIDFENNTISVNRGLTIVPKFDKDGNVVDRITVVSDTKTIASVREVPIPDILKFALREYFERQHKKEVEKDLTLTHKNNFVFGNDDGNLRTYSGTKKIFYRFLKKHNLTKYKIHFHALRHTYSNMLFEAEQNPKLIQALLGHKDVKTTVHTNNRLHKIKFLSGENQDTKVNANIYKN